MIRATRYILFTCISLSMVLSSGKLLAQYDRSRGDQPEAEFHMARLIYSPSTSSNRGFWREMWAIDYPAAEYHFTQGVRRLTHINTGGDSIHLRLTDERIFDYPWLFAQQVGTWTLNESEALRLREYLMRGGFLIVDDFHGNYEWVVFTNSIRRVFPDRPIVNLTDEDEILHVFYDLDRNTQIPGRRHLYRTMSGNIDAQMQGPATWKGIFDDDGRLLVAINFNIDMGDAWEHADDPVYPEPMTALAYRFGINYLIYAFTH
jgi:hypothetical protein